MTNTATYKMRDYGTTRGRVSDVERNNVNLLRALYAAAVEAVSPYGTVVWHADYLRRIFADVMYPLKKAW
ncbi:MAG: hypothetical protein SFH39_18465 [Candidatus Magnetobacterium sp. LHC-1]|nr:hypothetical protein [Nitrospirota bacterium]